jgi:CzcA family heavy metal efflux pump
MMRWIIKHSLRFRYLVVAFALAMLVFGVGAFRQMPVDVFPEFAPPRVQIQTACLGLTAAEVESLVTVPMEQAFNGIDGLDVMRSKSAPQLSYLELVFKRGTDEMHARQLVQERMATVQNTLPTWAAPPIMMQPLSATSRVMKIGLSSETTSLEDMSMTAYWKIRARLLRVKGVANVAIWGERIKAYQVGVEPGKLQTENVSLDRVMEVTAQALDAGILKFAEGEFIGTGGFIDTPNQRLGIRHTSPIVTPEDLASVVLAERDGTTLRIADVAQVTAESPLLAGDAVINDGPGLMLVVEKLPWGNTLEVTRGVENAIDEMRPGLPGLEIDTTIFRPASFVQEAIDHLTSSLVVGALLVVFVLGIFLLDWRAALISVVTIPLSLVATIFVLHARGATINTMVLAGLVIALGAIVDDAIVDVENIVRRLRLARAEGSTQSTASIILESSLEVRGAVVYASLIEAFALLPIFFLTSLTGSFFKPLAFTYALAVLVSLVVAMISTPALSLLLFARGKVQFRESPVAGWLQRGYARAVTPIVRRPLPAYAAVALLAVGGLAVIPRLGEELFPEFKERDFLMHWLSKPGTSLPEERRIVIQGSRELRSIEGVRNFGSHIGQALLGEEIAGVDFGENWISIDPKADYEETRAKIEEAVAAYPGMFTNVETYLAERISEVISGESEPVVVRITGPDLKVLRDKAEEVKHMLGDVKGVDAVNVELQTEVPQIEVEVDLAKAKARGVKPGDVRRAAATIVSGEEVGDVFRDGKTYDVDVWSTPESRDSIDDIGNVLVDAPNGEHVRLGDVATVSVQPTPNFIKHEGSVRRIDIGAEVRGRDVGSVARDVESGMKKIDFPLEHHAQVIGVFAERQAAQRRLAGYAIVTAIGIFLILLSVLRKLRLAILTFITLPIALVGGVIGNYLAGGVISIGSLVGFFTVLGIVARNGIMMISHFQHLEQEEGVPFGRDLVIRGARERIAPIMMTALTTALALVPLILAGNIAGQEIEYPMGIVILGGLITSTVINLFVVPSLYLRFAKRGGWRAISAAGGEPQMAAT